MDQGCLSENSFFQSRLPIATALYLLSFSGTMEGTDLGRPRTTRQPSVVQQRILKKVPRIRTYRNRSSFCHQLDLQW
jgi:hypothetical protein